MPTLTSSPDTRFPGAANLSNAQTGNGASTNIVDCGGNAARTALVKITTTVGTITTATTVRKILRPNHPWRFLRLSYSENTNVTNTADVWVF